MVKVSLVRVINPQALTRFQPNAAASAFSERRAIARAQLRP
jgi:hypothetical protein